MARARIKLKRAGVKALLGDEGVRAELTRHAERVASAAGDGAVVEQATTGGYRAVVQVHDTRPGSMQRQAQSGQLVRALDSA